jgi:hypothetical protein
LTSGGDEIVPAAKPWNIESGFLSTDLSSVASCFSVCVNTRAARALIHRRRSAKLKFYVIMKSTSIGYMYALLITTAFLGTGCASGGSRLKPRRIISTSTAPYTQDHWYHASEGFYNLDQKDGYIN